MVRFDTIKAEEIRFGANDKNFVEIARKKAVSETPEGTTENEFISVSRGYYTPDGQKRFKNSVAVPVDQAKAVAEALKKV